jgi:uncharacterized protein (TIGR00255 family)
LLLSMTGHGAARLQQDGVVVTVEVRTVNNRYFKLSLRSTEGYAALESRIDELIRQSIRRGTVQLDLRIERETSAENYRLNEAVITSYYSQLRMFGISQGIETDVRLESLLALPGVVSEQAASGQFADMDWPVISKTIRLALDGLGKMRQDEGRAMAKDLDENCTAIGRELASIETLAPRVVEAYRSRLTERLSKLLAEHGVSVQTADVVREVGLFAERSDISEEIVRLNSHLEQFREITNSAESNGRKLEFVTQEMFREANTIGSKSNDATIARHVIEIKTAIERIREMIQNVE